VQMDLPKTSALQVPLAEIEQASTRAANLCRQMMAYAGTGPHRFEEVNLSRLLVEIRPLLGVSLGEPIRLELDLAERLPAIRADAMQLRQVALNVVVNAVEAIEPKPGVIRMSTREASLTTAELRERFQAPDLVGGATSYGRSVTAGAGCRRKCARMPVSRFSRPSSPARGWGWRRCMGYCGRITGRCAWTVSRGGGVR